MRLCSLLFFLLRFFVTKENGAIFAPLYAIAVKEE